jgi:hypothetical protein
MKCLQVPSLARSEPDTSPVISNDRDTASSQLQVLRDTVDPWKHFTRKMLRKMILAGSVATIAGESSPS